LSPLRAAQAQTVDSPIKAAQAQTVESAIIAAQPQTVESPSKAAQPQTLSPFSTSPASTGPVAAIERPQFIPAKEEVFLPTLLCDIFFFQLIAARGAAKSKAPPPLPQKGFVILCFIFIRITLFANMMAPRNQTSKMLR
jgi:hypothetical protein